jgi:hypothetical protein
MTARMRLLSAEAQAVVEHVGISVPTSAAVIEAEELAAIVLHIAPSLPPAEAEVVLLAAGVACDVTGGHKHDIPSTIHRAILSAFPRPRFADYFLAAMQAQVHRNPGSHAALLMGAGPADSARLHQEWSRATASLNETA